MVEKFTKSKSILNREEIIKLHNASKHRLSVKNSNMDFKEVIHINRLILEKVHEKLITNEGGVVLDGFGYFCIWRTPSKVRVRNVGRGNSEEFHFNPHSNGHFYFPTLLTNIYSGSILKGWYMDGAFNATLKKNMSDKIKSGFKYKLFYSMVKSLNLRYENQKKRKLIKNKKW